MPPKRIYNYLARIYIFFFVHFIRCSFNVCISWTNFFNCYFLSFFWFRIFFFSFSRQIDCIRCDRWNWKCYASRKIKRCLITKWFCWMFCNSRDGILCIVQLYVIRIYYPRTTYCLSSALAYTQHTIDGYVFFCISSCCFLLLAHLILVRLCLRAGFWFCKFKHNFKFRKKMTIKKNGAKKKNGGEKKRVASRGKWKNVQIKISHECHTERNGRSNIVLLFSF